MVADVSISSGEETEESESEEVAQRRLSPRPVPRPRLSLRSSESVRSDPRALIATYIDQSIESELGLRDRSVVSSASEVLESSTGSDSEVDVSQVESIPVVQDVSLASTPVVSRPLPRRSFRQSRPPDRYDSCAYMNNQVVQYPDRVLQRARVMKSVLKALLSDIVDT